MATSACDFLVGCELKAILELVESGLFDDDPQINAEIEELDRDVCITYVHA
jgi:hypothetical protein